MKSTNHILDAAVSETNKTVKLSSVHPCKSKSISPAVKKSQRKLLIQSRVLNDAVNKALPQGTIDDLKAELKGMKSEHQRLIRYTNMEDSVARDQELHSVLSKDPSSLYRAIRRSKNTNSCKIQRLTVRDRVYLGDRVADGFFDSLSKLKTVDSESLERSPTYCDFSEYYEHIVEICAHGEKIPQITEAKSEEILKSIKAGVSDLYSITASHYTNAGELGIRHFHLLLTALIDDISKMDITEVNAVYANVLFKGHNKDKNSDRSYRTYLFVLWLPRHLTSI